MLFTSTQMQMTEMLTVAPEINFCVEKQLYAGCGNHNHSSAREGCEKTLIVGLWMLMGLLIMNIVPLLVLPMHWLQKILCRTE